jgi:asparagine synthase (glutamine-hydrolysing)
MCGIAGYAPRDPERPVAGEAIGRMLRTLVHRGPDGAGIHAGAGIGIGCRRLAIVDLERGDQPIANEDGSLVVVCNGEIYDAPETRTVLERAGHVFRSRSDAAVIPHLYEEHGLGFVDHLRGMFALALWDARRRRLVLARDRLGMKPLCYREDAEGVWFASEAKAILAGSGAAARLEPRALRDVLTMGFVSAPRTMFEAIRRLPAGCLYVHESGRSRVERYWDVRFPLPGERPRFTNDDDWTDALRAKLRESVRLHMRSDVPVGALLSGGLDSSSVTSLACELVVAGRMRSYSAGFDVAAADEPRHRRMLYDFAGSALVPRLGVARAADLAALPWSVWCVEDPAGVGSSAWRFRVASLAAGDGVKVVLTGEGADEALGGYPWYRGVKALGPLLRLPLAVRRALLLGPVVPRLRPGLARMLLAPHDAGGARFRAIVGTWPWGRARTLLSPELRATIDRADAEDGAEEELELPAEYGAWHSFDRLQYLDLKLRLADLVNAALDRETMAYSVEARLPFLDHQLVELCCAIPRHLRMRGLREKYVLRRAMRGIVPAEILERQKLGTRSPLDAWLRAPVLPAAIEEALSEERLRAVGCFSSGSVRKLFGEHRAGAVSRGRDLLVIAAVQTWHDVFQTGRVIPERPAFAELHAGS